jgi:hypothetical protein
MTAKLTNPSTGRKPTAYRKGEKPRKPSETLAKTTRAVKKRTKTVIKALADGATLQVAGEAAGYKKSNAAKIASNLIRNIPPNSPIIRALVESGVDLKRITDKVSALMDAKTTKFFQKDGIVTDQREVDALETQRKTTELAARLHGVLSTESTSATDAMAGSIMGAILVLRAQQSMQIQAPVDMGDVVVVEDKPDAK